MTDNERQELLDASIATCRQVMTAWQASPRSHASLWADSANTAAYVLRRLAEIRGIPDPGNKDA